MPAARTPVYLDPAGHAARVAALDLATGELENLDRADLTITVGAVGAVTGDPIDVTARLDATDTILAIDPDEPATEALLVDVTLVAGTVWSTAATEATFYADPAAAAYGATVAGVEALVANLTLGYGDLDGVTVADVRTFLTAIGDRVAARLGPLDALPEPRRTTFTSSARSLVILGAAAYTEDAAHPERSRAQGDSSYGATLWARFLAGLDELEAQLAQARAEAGVAGAGTGGLPAAAFPAPLIRRDLGH